MWEFLCSPLRNNPGIRPRIYVGYNTVDLDDLFLFEAKRRVMKDRTVSLAGRLYEVDPLLVGRTVTLRYDPSVPPTRPLQVVHDGRDAVSSRHHPRCLRQHRRQTRPPLIADRIRYLRTRAAAVAARPAQSQDAARAPAPAGERLT